MNKPPAFQFYAQDFLTGVVYLTNEEIGIYIKMLCKQWTDGQIPKKRLGFLVGLDWDKFSDELKDKFVDKGDFLINERLEKEREKKINFHEKQKENGKKGGRPKTKTSKKSTVSEEEKPNGLISVNPNKSQKKPLEEEDEIEIEVEVEKEKRKKKKEKGEIFFPFDDENFNQQWKHWKIYKDKEFKFKYKTIQSEQAALNDLANKAKGNEKTAIAIMHQSMANGWKGFFELKNKTNTINKGFEADEEYHKKVYESEIAKTWNK